MRARYQHLAPDLVFAAGLLLAALVVRWLFARAVTFPPLDDPAFYLVTAKNLASGRGLVVDALWSYHTLFPSVTHPSHEHWMPMATLVNAAAFAAEGALRGELVASLGAAQVPGAVLGALLAPLTYIYGRRHLPRGSGGRWLLAGAALFVAVNATLAYQCVSGDSSAPFAFLAAAALATAAPPVTRARSLATGALIALAYLARADGLLLLAVALLFWLIPMVRRQAPAGEIDAARPRPAHLALLLAGFGLVVTPWLVRNWLAFGTPLPGSLLAQAWLGDYTETFNYQTQPTLQALLAQGWDTILLLRWQALVNNGRVFLLTTFPWGVLAIPGLWALRRRAAWVLPATYGLILFFVTALAFPVSAMWGTFYHSFAALLPFLAAAAVHALWLGSGALRRAGGRLREVAVGAILAGVVVLAAAQVVVSLATIKDQHEAEEAQFQAITGWLVEHAAPGTVIMTTQPYTLNYASGYPAIVLPAAEGPEAAWAAARRYGAGYLVITQPFGLYPEILQRQGDERFRLVERLAGAEVYEIGDGAR